MTLSGILQFILGFILGVFLLVVGAAGAAYFLLARIGAETEKPVFPETKKVESTQVVKTQPSAADTTEITSKPEEQLEPGAYRAKVTWPQGLSLRAEPSLDAKRIGGIGYDWEVVVLRKSEDGKWQRVRIPRNNQIGWVKAGNVKKIEDSE